MLNGTIPTLNDCENLDIEIAMIATVILLPLKRLLAVHLGGYTSQYDTQISQNRGIMAWSRVVGNGKVFWWVTGPVPSTGDLPYRSSTSALDAMNLDCE